MAAKLSLSESIRLLRVHYGPSERLPTSDPFELILLENVAYLASGPRRRAAFALLKSEVGTDPKSVADASEAALERAAAHGILKGTFAAKLRECGRIALALGDLRTLAKGPFLAARRALVQFPGIGEPGAEKILLFAGMHPLLAPESNGLRVMV